MSAGLSTADPAATAAAANSVKKLVVDVFSDVACPWCWVGKRSIEKAAENLNAQGTSFQLELHWHPFQLNPDIPSGSTQNVIDHLTHIIGSRAMVQQWVANPGLIPMNQRCSAAGLANIQFAIRENGVVFNTYKAHELLTYVGEIKKDYVKQNALKEILLRMTHWEGKNLDLTSELVKACTEANVTSSVHEVENICKDATVINNLNTELRRATQLRNFSGVPYFIFPTNHVISGAESVANFERILTSCLKQIREL